MDLASGFFVGAGLMLSSVQHDFTSYRNWQDVSSKFVDECGDYQVNGWVIQNFPKRGMTWDYRSNWIYSPDSSWYQRGGADYVHACTVYRRFSPQSEQPPRLGERIHHAGKDVVSKSDRFDVVRGYRSDEFLSAYGQVGYWGNTGLVLGSGTSSASVVLGVVSDVSTDGVLSFGGRVGLSKDWFTVYGTGGYAVEPSLGSAPFVGAGVAISVGSGVSLLAESRFWQISNYSVDYNVLDRTSRSSVLVGLTYRFD